MYVRVKKCDKLHLGWNDFVQLYLRFADQAATGVVRYGALRRGRCGSADDCSAGHDMRMDGFDENCRHRRTDRTAQPDILPCDEAAVPQIPEGQRRHEDDLHEHGDKSVGAGERGCTAGDRRYGRDRPRQ